MKRFAKVLVACLALPVAACGGSRPTSAPAEVPRSATPEPAASGQAQLSWYLGAIAGTEAIDDEALRRHFTPDFLAQIPPAAFRKHTESLRAAVRRFELVRLEATTSSERVHGIARAPTGTVFHVLLAVELQPPHRITLLVVRPEAEPVKAPSVQSWNDAERELRALAPRASLLAAAIDADGCIPIHSLAADESFAVGSTYKLFVLGALGQDIDRGTRSWSDSFSGGEARTLQAAAERMIEKSDNAAADGLVLALGRESIERFAQSSGVTDTRLVPLLLTRETFGLKYAASDAERTRFTQADRAERLLLAEDASRRIWTPPASPSAVAVVGWFAPLRGLCAASASLRRMFEHPKTAPIKRILAANPGIADTAHSFSYVGYKGGSEPGIFNVNFLLQRASDGKWLYLGATLNDERNLIDERKAVATLGAIRAFFGGSSVEPTS